MTFLERANWILYGAYGTTWRFILTAGPFDVTGPLMRAACIDARTHKPRRIPNHLFEEQTQA